MSALPLAVTHRIPLGESGTTIPVLGFGTWQAKPGEVAAALRLALDAGFRHIDCARIYRNEKEIGSVLGEYLKSGKLKREELFVTSKLWNTDHHPDLVTEAYKRTVEDLQVGYLDLYLMHWPVSLRHPEKFETDQDFWQKNDEGGTHQNPVPLIDTWRAMEKLVEQGLVKAIGVSNFSPQQLKDLYAEATVKPVAHQIELQPALCQRELKSLHKEYNMVTEAYCPLGVGYAPGHPASSSSGLPLIQQEKVIEIAKAANVPNAAQLLLRWNAQDGNIVLTKSVNPERIAEAAATPMGGLSFETQEALVEYGKANPRRCVQPMLFFEKGPTPFFS